MFTRFFGLKFNPFSKEIGFDQLFDFLMLGLLTQFHSQAPVKLQYCYRGQGKIAGSEICRVKLTHILSEHGLKQEEVKDYCSSRLQIAGLHDEVFTPAAIEAIYGITKGLPRLVNNLVTTCLIIASGKKERQIDEDIVYQAQQEQEIQFSRGG